MNYPVCTSAGVRQIEPTSHSGRSDGPRPPGLVTFGPPLDVLQPANRLLIAALLLAVGLSAVSGPIRHAIQIGADEGFELSKATLCLSGHAPYKEIWNDQPPLHTWILTKGLMAWELTVDGRKPTGTKGPVVGKFVVGGPARESREQKAETLNGSHSPLVPRLVTTAFTIILLGSFFFTAFRVSGVLVATVAAFLLTASPGFVELSSSVMLEIPALSLALAALAVLVTGRDAFHRVPDQFPGENLGRGGTRPYRIIIAGALFGLAALTKLVPLYLLPLAALILWIGDRRKENGEWRGQQPRPPNQAKTHLTLPLLLLGMSMIAAFVATDLLIERGAYLLHFGQSWTSHFGPQKNFEHGSPADHPFPWILLLRNWDTTAPALLGVLFLLHHNLHLNLNRSHLPKSEVRGPKSELHPLPRLLGSKFAVRSSMSKVLPVLWLALSVAVFAAHKPWWSYYYIHIAIPLCWCAAIGIVGTAKLVAADVRRLRRPFKSEIRNQKSEISPPFSILNPLSSPRLALTLFTLYALTAAAWAGTRVYLQITGIRNSPQTYSSLVLTEMARFKPFTEWLYTDEPVYSFHTGIPMPPDLAVIMLKRYWSGEMTNARLAAELGEIKPGLILLRNNGQEVPFQDLLRSDYRLVYQDGDHRLYAHRSISKKPKI